MSAVRACVRTFTIGRFTAEVSIPPLERGAVSSVATEWSPRVPRFEVDFTPAQRVEYQRKLIGVLSDNEGMS